MDGLVDRGDHQVGHGGVGEGLHRGGQDGSDVEETVGQWEGDGLYTNTVRSQSDTVETSPVVSHHHVARPALLCNKGPAQCCFWLLHRQILYGTPVIDSLCHKDPAFESLELCLYGIRELGPLHRNTPVLHSVDRFI